MQDVLTRLAAIHRPRLLIRAARIGADEYRRDRHLRRIFGYGKALRHSEAALRLADLEDGLNEARQAGDARYSVIRHIDVLSALIAEARLLRGAVQGL